MLQWTLECMYLFKLVFLFFFCTSSWRCRYMLGFRSWTEYVSVWHTWRHKPFVFYEDTQACFTDIIFWFYEHVLILVEQIRCRCFPCFPISLSVVIPSQLADHLCLSCWIRVSSPVSDLFINFYICCSGRKGHWDLCPAHTSCRSRGGRSSSVCRMNT